jgi:glucan biosynthesis protein C
MTRRLHYIDWLRVLAVLLLFPFHTSRVFNFGEAFYVKSPYLSMAINYSLGFVDRWHMPLLFLLAGCSAYFSLAKRSPGTFARERWVRLGVPLLFGILVIMPPQTYVGARFNSGYTETFRYYITSLDFLRWNIHDGGDYYGGFGVGQLWFILFLLVFSMVALPIFAWGRSERGSARVGAWARRLARPAWWLLPPAILWFAEGMPDLFGKRAVYYLVLFILGFIVVADDAFAESAERYRFAALAIGTVLCAGYVAAWPVRESLPDPSVALTAVNYLGMLGVWTMLIGMLGAGRRYLDRPSRSLSYLAEASYPVYILHQTAIVVLAWFVVKAPIGGVAQWVVILAGSVIASFAIYEVVRRVGPLRFLFGMRPRAR